MTHVQHLAGLCLLLSFAAGARAASWFESESRTCDFESPVASSLKPLLERKKTQGGGQYFRVPKLLVNELLSAQSGSLYIAEALTPAQSSSIKTSIEAFKGGPKAASMALAVLDKVSDFSPIYALPSGALISWLTSKADANIVSLDRFKDFIAVGGRLGHQIAFRPPTVGSKPLIMVNSLYEVQVGSEPKPRRWLLTACLLPLEVILTEVETKDTGPNANNKRLLRQPDGTWRMWDIADNKFDNKTLLYREQDEQHAYFVDSRDADTAYRVHFYGGAMQTKVAGQPGWSMLYSAVRTN